MIFITGDTHGDFWRIKNFCNKMKTSKKEDIMIILGDVGLNFYLNKTDHKSKVEVSQIPITFFMIHGNHEERPQNVPGYEEKQWHGGTVYVHPEFPNQIFAKDGEIYDFDGKKVITIGGAYSVDKNYRLAMHWPWFESEQPDEDTKKYVESKLDKVNWKVDAVFSHTCPINYEPRHMFLKNIDQSKVDKSTEKWLQEIEEKLDFKKWYFGHFHGEWKIGKFQMMFEDIDELKIPDKVKDISNEER